MPLLTTVLSKANVFPENGENGCVTVKVSKHVNPDASNAPCLDIGYIACFVVDIDCGHICHLQFWNSYTYIISYNYVASKKIVIFNENIFVSLFKNRGDRKKCKKRKVVIMRS